MGVFVSFLLFLIFCVEVCIMREFSAQTQIFCLLVCPTFYGSAILDFFELKCRFEASHNKNNFFYYKYSSPISWCQTWMM